MSDNQNSYNNRAASDAVLARYNELKGNFEEELDEFAWNAISSSAAEGIPTPIDATLPEPARAWCQSFEALTFGDRVFVYQRMYPYPGASQGQGRRRKTKKAGRRKTKKGGSKLSPLPIGGRRRKTKKAGSWKY